MALRMGTNSLVARGGRALLPALASGLQRAFAASSGSEKFTVEVHPCKAHKIEPPSNVVETSIDELLGMYELMYKMRRMEIAADMMYKAKLIRGFCHLYDGQEAVMTGIEAALTKDDAVITSYRDHCQHLSRGGTIKEVMAELMGKRDGATRGLGGSMHMCGGAMLWSTSAHSGWHATGQRYNRAANFYGGNGIVGAQIPLGAGLAFALKYEGKPNVAVTMYGDGAANQGQKYEALNIAGLWNLPVLFVCENNHYGMGTAEWRAAKSSTFYTRGDYIPGLKVDGMDVLAVKHATAYAKKYALENGPIVLEMDTYRYHGHSMSDPGSTYRTRDEISTMRQERDPVERVRKLLIAHGYDSAALKTLEKAVKKEVDAAVEESKSAQTPPDDWLWRNVYVAAENTALRAVDGSMVTPKYDPTYAS